MKEQGFQLALNPDCTQNPLCRSKRAMAFHEKAGRSQVSSFVFWLDKVFSPAE